MQSCVDVCGIVSSDLRVRELCRTDSPAYADWLHSWVETQQCLATLKPATWHFQVPLPHWCPEVTGCFTFTGFLCSLRPFCMHLSSSLPLSRVSSFSVLLGGTTSCHHLHSSVSPALHPVLKFNPLRFIWHKLCAKSYASPSCWIGFLEEVASPVSLKDV